MSTLIDIHLVNLGVPSLQKCLRMQLGSIGSSEILILLLLLHMHSSHVLVLSVLAILDLWILDFTDKVMEFLLGFLDLFGLQLIRIRIIRTDAQLSENITDSPLPKPRGEGSSTQLVKRLTSK